MAGLAGDLDLLLLVLPLAAVAHQVGVEVAVDAGEPREAVDVGLGAAGGAAVVERRRGGAAGAGLGLLDLVEPLVGEGDPAAPAVAAEAAVVGDAGVDGGVRARDGAGEPARDVARRAAAAVSVDGVVPVAAERVEVAARRRASPRCRSAGEGSAFASVSLIDAVPRGSGISPKAQRSTETMPLARAMSDVATRCASRTWQPARPQVSATVRRAPGSGSIPACARALSNARALPRWQDGAADGGARVGAARVFLGPDVAGDAALRPSRRRGRGRGRAGPARCLSRPRATRSPARARRRPTTSARVRNISGRRGGGGA